MAQEFWQTVIIGIWVLTMIMFVAGKVKWFWGLIFTSYSMLAVAALMFLSVGSPT